MSKLCKGKAALPRTRQTTITLLTLFLLILTTSLLPISYADPDWLDGWRRRKSHTLICATDAGTNYQFNVTVHYGSGTDDGENVYLGENCQEDFDDIRATLDDGSTLLNGWREAKIDSDYAKFWFKHPSDLSSTNRTIYLYYDNSEATWTDDGINTFILFDDFAAWNTTTWGEKPAYADIVSGNLEITATYSDNFVYSTATFDREVAFMTLSQNNFLGTPSLDKTCDMGWKNSASWNDKLLKYSYHPSQDNAWKFTTASSGSSTEFRTEISQIANEWFRHEESWRTDSAKYWINGTLAATVTTTVPSVSMTVGLRAYDNEGSETKNKVDWVAVRKFVDPEPSHGAWGSEEGEFLLTFRFNEGGQFRVNGTIVTDGQEVYYVDGEVAELLGIPDASYSFDEFTWDGESYSDNPLLELTVESSLTVWCYFEVSEEADTQRSVFLLFIPCILFSLIYEFRNTTEVNLRWSGVVAAGFWLVLGMAWFVLAPVTYVVGLLLNGVGILYIVRVMVSSVRMKSLDRRLGD